MKTEKLYLMSINAFEIEDYDNETLTVTIKVDGFEDTDTIRLKTDDILDRAMAAQEIDSYYDHAYKDADYFVELDGKKYAFGLWWKHLCPISREEIYSAAIATRSAQGLERIYRELVLPVMQRA